MAIAIEEYGVCYFPAPKVANTSLKHLFYEVTHGRRYETRTNEDTGQKIHIHKEYPTPLFRDVDLSQFDNFLRFCVIRDPVERALSVWRNRVVHHQELSAEKSSTLRLKTLRLPHDPDLGMFVDNLEAYRSIKGSIRTHSDPLVDFLGMNADYYHMIFRMDQLNLIENFFLSLTGSNVALRRLQTGGPKVSISDLTATQINKLKKFYEADYDVYGKFLSSAGAGVPRVRSVEKAAPADLEDSQAASGSPWEQTARSMDVKFGALPLVKTVWRRCPSCRSSGFSGRVSYPSNKPTWGKLEICVCEKCGFGYVPKIKFDLSKYYRAQYGKIQNREKIAPPFEFFRDIDSNDSRIVRRARAQSKLILSFKSPIDRMAEFGPGLGALFHYVDAAERHAVELDEISFPYLDYLKVQRLPQADLKPGYDLVVASHFLEHLPIDLALPFLKHCRRLLSKDGLLLLEVPEWGWVHHRVLPKRGNHEPHTLFFSPQSLLAMLKSSGLKVRYLKTLDKVFDVGIEGKVNLNKFFPIKEDGTHLVVLASPQ